MFSVAVIGLGMGQAHLTGYSAVPDLRIDAIADLDEARLAACGERFGVPKATTRYEEVLAMPGVDAVSVCLPNHLHAPVTVAALQAGKHVLVEKPMAMDAAEATRMLEAARRAGRTLAVAMNYRWGLAPESYYLKGLVEQGRLGQIHYLRSVSLRRRTFPRGHRTWFSERQRSGGGGLIDMGPHMLDLAMWLADDYAPVQGYGVTRTALMTDTDVDDLASGLVRLAGGATIALESTWASFTRPGASVAVFGTLGGAILDLSSPAGQRLTLFGQDGETLVDSSPVDIRLADPPEASVQAHFVAAVRAGHTPENSGERGLAVMRAIDSIYRSSATGAAVAIPAA
jgi:predicted dehydrogenase